MLEQVGAELFVGNGHIGVVGRIFRKLPDREFDRCRAADDPERAFPLRARRILSDPDGDRRLARHARRRIDRIPALGAAARYVIDDPV